MDGWTAFIAAVGAVLTALILRVKEIYEIMVSYWTSSRTASDAKDDKTIVHLEKMIDRLQGEVSTHKSALNFLSREQLRYLRAEASLWGYIQWLYDYATNLHQQFIDNGLKVEAPPPVPEREVWQLPDEEGFQRRTNETKDRLEKAVTEAATKASGNSGEQKAVPPA